MKNKKTKVFVVDDEFPMDEKFRKDGVYNRLITGKELYRLAVDHSWDHLFDLQQLIKEVVTHQVYVEGLVELSGLNTPTKVLTQIDNGNFPDIIIYDWEYPDAPITSLKSKEWLLEILNRSEETFVFVYSKMRDKIPTFLNSMDFAKYSSRFQLFLKGGGLKSSFSAEEFILQYIVGCATNNGRIKIDGIDIEFTSNNYLSSASDILYLQRILGYNYILEELNTINFKVNTSSVEKILNDSNGFLYYNSEKKILISPHERIDFEKVQPYVKMSYLDVVKKFSISVLEDTLERGILPI